MLGPGGIGKTRLALKAARREIERFAHGAHFVDLTALSSADLLSTALLHALHAPQPAGVELDDYLLVFLHDKQMLLVLDNYEHLLSEPEPDRRDGYGLIAKIAATAPQIKLLVTSRAPERFPAGLHRASLRHDSLHERGRHGGGGSQAGQAVAQLPADDERGLATGLPAIGEGGSGAQGRGDVGRRGQVEQFLDPAAVLAQRARKRLMSAGQGSPGDSSA